MRLRAWALIAALVSRAPPSLAGPNLPLEHPAWDELRDAIAEGRLSDPLGGVQSLGAERVFSALSLLRGEEPGGGWARPVDRALLRAFAAGEHDRPYSLPLRERELAGFVAPSCEYQEGRPCGDGAGGSVELDSAAGYADLITAATRLRFTGGSEAFGTGLELDRAYLKLEYRALLLQVGRDALALGPSVRAAEMVSAHAVPQDGIRAQLHPVALASWLRLSLFYFLDRLRDPQAFRATLLDCTRAQLDFADRVQLGGSRLLQLGGKGAPDFGGFWGFIAEHFGRTVAETVSNPENNRLSFDLSLRLPELRGARIYYELALEDTRSHFFNMLQFDADHLIGLEVRALRLGPWRRLFVELQHTGWVSQEHSTFTTGMTNGGRTLGSALGPDGTSLWVRADLAIGSAVLSPWAEVARFVSDLYGSDQDHGVFVTAVGPMEHRQRAGFELQAPLGRDWRVSAGAFAERVQNADLVAGATRFNAGLHALLTFTP